MRHPNKGNPSGSTRGLAARRWRAWIGEQLEPLGLTEPKRSVLCCLSSAGGGAPQHQLSEQTGIDGTTLLKTLAELQRSGILERRDDEADRRAKSIRLTNKAEPVLARIAECSNRLGAELLAGISQPEMEAFRKVLLRMTGNIRDPRTCHFASAAGHDGTVANNLEQMVGFQRRMDAILLISTLAV
jgi:MarR family transcriptional regulator for hemolysin